MFTYDADNRVMIADGRRVGGTIAQTATGTSGYDAEGDLTDYRVTFLGNGYANPLPTGVNVGDVEAFHVSYFKKDGYLEQQTAGTSTNTNLTPATTTSIYDALGQRVATDEALQHVSVPDTVRVFSYDGDGQILSRRDGTVSSGVFQLSTAVSAAQHYYDAEGHEVANLDESGTINIRDGIDATAAFSSQNSYTGSYVVQAGDTLQSIAQTVYGNANLWYVIADANALSVDSSGTAINLVAGTTLKLPAVSNEQNSSQTFTPYNPLKLIGSTTPALAYIPPPPSGHCNTLADLIVVATTMV